MSINNKPWDITKTEPSCLRSTIQSTTFDYISVKKRKSFEFLMR